MLHKTQNTSGLCLNRACSILQRYQKHAPSSCKFLIDRVTLVYLIRNCLNMHGFSRAKQLSVCLGVWNGSRSHFIPLFKFFKSKVLQCSEALLYCICTKAILALVYAGNSSWKGTSGLCHRNSILIWRASTSHAVLCSHAHWLWGKPLLLSIYELCWHEIETPSPTYRRKSNPMGWVLPYRDAFCGVLNSVETGRALVS